MNLILRQIWCILTLAQPWTKKFLRTVLLDSALCRAERWHPQQCEDYWTCAYCIGLLFYTAGLLFIVCFYWTFSDHTGIGIKILFLWLPFFDSCNNLTCESFLFKTLPPHACRSSGRRGLPDPVPDGAPCPARVGCSCAAPGCAPSAPPTGVSPTLCGRC